MTLGQPLKECAISPPSLPPSLPHFRPEDLPERESEIALLPAEIAEEKAALLRQGFRWSRADFKVGVSSRRRAVARSRGRAVARSLVDVRA